MPMLRLAKTQGLLRWPRRGEGSSGMVLGMVLVVILCVAVIGGSVFFIVTSWPGEEEERQWDGAAPPPGVGPAPKDGPPPGQGGGQRDTGPPVGQVAPEIDGEDIDGVKFKLSDYRGKVVMLDFWGHW